MYKFTENGLVELGEVIELSDEDREFIQSMFDDYSNHERTDFSDYVFDI